MGVKPVAQRANAAPPGHGRLAARGVAPDRARSAVVAPAVEVAHGAMTRTQADRLALLAKRSRRTIDDVTELWYERAAMREYEARKSRKEAESLALDDVADVVLRPSAAERRAA